MAIEFDISIIENRLKELKTKEDRLEYLNSLLFGWKKKKIEFNAYDKAELKRLKQLTKDDYALYKNEFDKGNLVYFDNGKLEKSIAGRIGIKNLGLLKKLLRLQFKTDDIKSKIKLFEELIKRESSKGTDFKIDFTKYNLEKSFDDLIRIDLNTIKTVRETVNYITEGIERKILNTDDLYEKISICENYKKIFEQQEATPCFPKINFNQDFETNKAIPDLTEKLIPAHLQVLEWLKIELEYLYKEKTLQIQKKENEYNNLNKQHKNKHGIDIPFGADIFNDIKKKSEAIEGNSEKLYFYKDQLFFWTEKLLSEPEIINESEVSERLLPLLKNEISKLETTIEKPLTKTKREKLKHELTINNFFSLPKVIQLTETNKEKLVELLSSNPMPYGIAMFDELGFCDYLDNEQGTKYKANTILSRLYNEKAKDGTSSKHYRRSLIRPTKRYKAGEYKETVKKDYQKLK